MIKLVFCVRRLPHLSREEFQTYWRERHGPLVRRLAPVLGIQRYVQLHTLDGFMTEALRASRGGPEAYDGVAELSWKSEADLVAASASEAARRATEELLEDEKRFVDHARSPLWFATEVPIIEG